MSPEPPHLSHAPGAGQEEAPSTGAAAAALGVVVVTYKDPGPTRRCLAALAADHSPAPRAVVVVDNSPGPRPCLDPAELDPGVRLLHHPDNPGFGAGANRGVEALQSDDALRGFVILNHDVEVLPGFIGATAAALEPGVGAVAGPLYLDRPDGPLWYAGGGFRRLTGTVWQSHSPADAGRAREVGFLPGAALGVSAAAWRQTGGFDPHFFLYHEDLDLCLRLRRAGWRLRFEPGMRAVHHLGAATGSRRGSPLYLEHITRTRLRPHRSRAYRLYLAALHTPYALARALGLLAREGRAGAPKVRALLRGHRAALADLWRR